MGQEGNEGGRGSKYTSRTSRILGKVSSKRASQEIVRGLESAFTQECATMQTLSAQHPEQFKEKFSTWHADRTADLKTMSENIKNFSTDDSKNKHLARFDVCKGQFNNLVNAFNEGKPDKLPTCDISIDPNSFLAMTIVKAPNVQPSLAAAAQQPSPQASADAQAPPAEVRRRPVRPPLASIPEGEVLPQDAPVSEPAGQQEQKSEYGVLPVEAFKRARESATSQDPKAPEASASSPRSPDVSGEYGKMDKALRASGALDEAGPAEPRGNPTPGVSKINSNYASISSALQQGESVAIGNDTYSGAAHAAGTSARTGRGSTDYGYMPSSETKDITLEELEERSLDELADSTRAEPASSDAAEYSSVDAINDAQESAKSRYDSVPEGPNPRVNLRADAGYASVDAVNASTGSGTPNASSPDAKQASSGTVKAQSFEDFADQKHVAPSDATAHQSEGPQEIPKVDVKALIGKHREAIGEKEPEQAETPSQSGPGSSKP